MKKVVRRSVSVLLSVLMVVSMFAVGITSTGAASTNEDALGAASIPLPSYSEPDSGTIRSYLKINTTGIGWYASSDAAADYRAYSWLTTGQNVYNKAWPGETMSAAGIARRILC